MNGIQGRKPSAAQTAALFSITILLFIFIGYRAQHREFYSGILVTEFGLIMLPAFVFMLAGRFDIKNVMRFNSARPLNFAVTFFIMLFAIPLAGVFNLLNLLLVNSIFGRVILQPVPVAHNGRELLVNIIVIAGSAGLCEEFLFRGVIQRGLERFGNARAILIAAFLFSLTHMDFQKIFGTFLLGALIGFIVYRTNSLYCGMFAHFTNNAAAVLLSYVSTKILSIFGESPVQVSDSENLGALFSAFGDMPREQLIAVLFVYGFLFFFAAVVFILLFYALIRLNPVKRGANAYSLNNTSEGETSRDSGVAGLLWLAPGLLMITGIYFLEVSSFTGAQNGFIEAARRLLGI